MKLSKKEIEEAYLARLESETRQPETEEQRKLAKERRARINKLSYESLRKQGFYEAAERLGGK
ncbi:hypothetical protein [Lactobacillus iners]|uniref:Uncharacterized protein n=1 Tax=Lactobacillus iners DSM 13335 TaxID=525328 RepID=C8PDE1_9LACO|nr:hypothetical protein [Lactobacillus iners]EEW51491.1 hypothetical protein HMPREF0520_1111 [Lactobacillus iners DSM 13335]KRL58644.1 hypothetical protein FC42_GL000784 [Lactobacillus iners DSM 13335]PNH16959.1 histidine kinase [Lactobacillus iners]QGA00257.1 histidine kinase [Lactobacillus iners]QIH21211.1 histidine kinase [Lactobacillus iners]